VRILTVLFIFYLFANALTIKKIKNFKIKSTKKVNTLILGAIINDKAFINGAWYKVKKNKKMILSTKNSKKILIIKDKNK